MLAVLLANRHQQVVDADPSMPVRELSLDRELLRPADDVLDHGPRREVAEVHDLLVAVLIGDLEKLVRRVVAVHLGHGGLDHRLNRLVCVPAAQLLDGPLVDGQVVGEVPPEDLRRGLGVGSVDLDLHVQSPGPQDRRVDQVLAVRRPDHDHVAQGLDAVDLGEELRHDRRFHVGADARPSRPEQRLHLVEEHDHRRAVLGLLACPAEHLADVALGLAHVLVEQLRALHIDEVAAGIAPGELGDLAGERCCDGLGDQRLAASRRAVQQDPRRRREQVLREKFLMQERQFHRVGDLLDLLVEASDVGVVQVGNLLEQQLVDLGPRQAFEHHRRALVEPHQLAGTQRGRVDVVAQFDHAFLVATPGDDRPALIGEHLAQGHDLADDVGPANRDHVEGLVQHHLLARRDLVEIERRGHLHADLSARRHDVDGPVVVASEQRPVRGRRLGQLVDLVAQRRDVVAGLAQGEGQLLVLRDRLGELPLGIEQSLFERSHAPRAFLEPPEQDGHLVPEDADLLAQRLVVRDELGGVARGAGCAAVSRALIGGVGLGGPGVDGVHLLSTRRT